MNKVKSTIENDGYRPIQVSWENDKYCYDEGAYLGFIHDVPCFELYDNDPSDYYHDPEVYLCHEDGSPFYAHFTILNLITEKEETIDVYSAFRKDLEKIINEVYRQTEILDEIDANDIINYLAKQ